MGKKLILLRHFIVWHSGIDSWGGGGVSWSLGCAVFAYIFFSLQSEKIPYFSLCIALSEYKRRTPGAPVSLLYFFRFKAKKIPYFRLFSL
jgi:hypothetical protein